MSPVYGRAWCRAVVRKRAAPKEGNHGSLRGVRSWGMRSNRATVTDHSDEAREITESEAVAGKRVVNCGGEDGSYKEK